MKVFARSRSFRAGDVLLVHQVHGGPSVRGAFVACSRKHWVLQRHSVEVDGSLVESVHERVLIPRERVSLVEVSRR